MRFNKTHPIDGMSDGVATEAIADDALSVLRAPLEYSLATSVFKTFVPHDAFGKRGENSTMPFRRTSRSS